VLFWHLLTSEQDYAYARPAMSRHKIRRLELLAGSPAQKGHKGIAGGKSKAVFDAERELSRQAEAAYQLLVSDWKASGRPKTGAGATPGRAFRRPSKGKAARQTPQAPTVCASLRQSPAPVERIPPSDATVHLTFIRR
jgi:transposase